MLLVCLRLDNSRFGLKRTLVVVAPRYSDPPARHAPTHDISPIAVEHTISKLCEVKSVHERITTGTSSTGRFPLVDAIEDEVVGVHSHHF